MASRPQIMAHFCKNVLRQSGSLRLVRNLHTTKFLEQQAAVTAKVVNGDLNKVPAKVRKFVEENAAMCQPDNIHIVDGSDKEYKNLLNKLMNDGQIKPLPKYDNCYLALTDPKDVARVESKTVISTTNKRDTIPTPASGVEGKLGHWLSPSDLDTTLQERFPGCMKGRTMYVLPFSMGPVGSPLSKIGIQCTDSAYVTACMRIMTRLGGPVLETLDNGEFVKCLHSIGQPLPMKKPAVNNWPCNPEKVIISHIPDENKIVSFGSGYGGNSLLGKKCFSLRLGSILARNEGWLAEHMLILGITNPKGEKRYIAAAFPSACGKTNLAMMVPSFPGYKVECVGDDIAWMRFDEQGVLRAINPEYGFFGVCPGTSMKTNPNAMLTMQSNTIFTNVAETSDGGYFWEGLEKETPDNVDITSWLGQKNWTPNSGKPAAHPNSRFCTPAGQCPMIDPEWESPSGVPIDAILFGGRRPQGVPLVYEAFNWRHGVFIGASVRSEATAAAEHKSKVVMHDPFAMRPFFGYNFGDYMKHWLSMEKRPNLKLPKIYHVNWFRKDTQGNFIWPGFGDNARVLEWIFRRVGGEDIAQETPIGMVPKFDSLNVEGLKGIDVPELFTVPKDFWLQECQEVRKYFNDQLGKDLPEAVGAELDALEQRVLKMS